jgi:UDP:flavonoid glycosyltransferase YjiC (YdhE family)
MPARVLLANEFGSGRGHVVSLLRAAQALGPGFVFEAALCRRAFQEELAPLNAVIHDGPHLAYRPRGRTGPDAVLTATWGEFLGDRGFDRPERLRDVLGWWHQVIASRRIDLVIADYAPLALMAARALGVPSVATGQGYGLPPDHLPVFPVLHGSGERRLHDEARLLDNVNRAAAGIGLPPLRGLPEVYRATRPMVRSLPLLDPYAEHRRHPHVMPEVDISSDIANSGDEVFVYFSTRELTDPEVVAALADLPLPRRGFLPLAPPEVSARLAASGMILEPAPIPVDLIARRSRLVLNAGQHGILCLGLFAGLPQVALPQHLEQDFHARRAEAAGVARVLPFRDRTRDRIVESIVAAWSDAGLAARAVKLAGSLRRGAPRSPQEDARAALTGLLPVTPRRNPLP